MNIIKENNLIVGKLYWFENDDGVLSTIYPGFIKTSLIFWKKYFIDEPRTQEFFLFFCPKLGLNLPLYENELEFLKEF